MPTLYYGFHCAACNERHNTLLRFAIIAATPLLFSPLFACYFTPPLLYAVVNIITLAMMPLRHYADDYAMSLFL